MPDVRIVKSYLGGLTVVTFLRNMKIRGKLFLGFFLVLAITLVVAVFGAYNLRQIDGQYTYALSFPMERYILMSELGVLFMDSRRTMNRTAMYMHDPDDPIGGINSQEVGINRLRGEIDVRIARFRANVDEDPFLDAEQKAERHQALNAYENRVHHYFNYYIAGLMNAARIFNETEAIRLVRQGVATVNQALVHYDFLNDTARTFMETISEELSAQTDSTFFLLIIFSIVGVAIGVAIALVISGTVTNPVVLLTAALGDMASGDLTKRLPDQGRDEIGRASASYNKSMEEFSRMIGTIKNQTGALSEIGGNLASNMTETASAMNEIAANIQSIKGRVLNQSASVTETNATMEQVTVNINKLSGQVDHQTNAVSQASSALEQMIANIQSVTATLVKNVKNVQDLQGSSETGRSSLQEVASDIQEIARESEGLMEINGVMENIASQTNLLSMNAAIEAAHAGDAGRGFAVVADEIRKLAESSGEQSKTIGSVLKKIKESIDKITRSTDNVLNKFEAIDLGVKTVVEQEEVIRRAMEEQGHGSKQVLSAAGQVGEVTGQVRGSSIEMLEGSKEVIQESKNLEKATQEITNGINEMAAGAEQVNKAVNTVNDLTGKTQENISSLARAVSGFKV